MADRAPIAPRIRSIRDQHLAAILHTVLEAPTGRKQLTAATKIGFGTITRLTAALIDAGYLEETAPEPTRPRTAGRPEIPLRVRTDGGKVVIGTQIQARVVTADAFTLQGNRVVNAEAAHRNRSPRSVIGRAVELTRDVVEQVGRERVLGLGISTGGHVEFETGRLISNPILGWGRNDLRGPFSRGADYPIVVDNSVRSLAVERLLWSDWAAGSMLVVVVARAISSALVVERSLYRGAGAGAGEIAHFPVETLPDDVDPAAPTIGALPPCTCGSLRCASTVLTDAALHRQALAANLVPGESDWNAVFADGPADLVALRRRRALLLGRTLGHLMAITDPEVAIVAGKVGDRADVAACMEQARSVPRRRSRTRTRIHHWRVTEHEWSAGAAALMVDDFLRHPTDYDSRLL